MAGAGLLLLERFRNLLTSQVGEGRMVRVAKVEAAVTNARRATRTVMGAVSFMDAAGNKTLG